MHFQTYVADTDTNQESMEQQAIEWGAVAKSNHNGVLRFYIPGHEFEDWQEFDTNYNSEVDFEEFATFELIGQFKDSYHFPLFTWLESKSKQPSTAGSLISISDQSR
jgi:hypothetical protein